MIAFKSEGQGAPAVSDLEVLPVTFDPGSLKAATHVHCWVKADICLYSNEIYAFFSGRISKHCCSHVFLLTNMSS